MADDKEEVETHDPHYEPIIQLPDIPIDTQTYEEDEDELLKLRAKLFRFDASESPGEWKERGTGEVKLLKHKESGRVRVVMRRDKTHKMCANHYITEAMNLIPSAGSERAWVWHTNADFADGETKEERLAIRFANAENAQKFKTHFDEGKTPFAAAQNGETRKDADSSDDEDEDENKKDEETSKESAEESDVADVAEANTTSTSTDDVTAQLENVKLSDTVAKTDENDKESNGDNDKESGETKPAAET